MTRRPPQLHVHVDRVVLDGVTRIDRDTLAGAIGAALVETLTPGAEPQRLPVAPATHVGRQVAPAVLRAMGMEARR